MNLKTYDYKAARSIIQEHRESLREASLGMAEDWFWTAETVWENGDFCHLLEKGSKVAGIEGSNWATPTLLLVLKDGDEKRFNCYSGESTGCAPFGISNGCLSKPAIEHIASIPLSV